MFYHTNFVHSSCHPCMHIVRALPHVFLPLCPPPLPLPSQLNILSMAPITASQFGTNQMMQQVSCVYALARACMPAYEHACSCVCVRKPFCALESTQVDDTISPSCCHCTSYLTLLALSLCIWPPHFILFLGLPVLLAYSDIELHTWWWCWCGTPCTESNSTKN